MEFQTTTPRRAALGRMLGAALAMTLGRSMRGVGAEPSTEAEVLPPLSRLPLLEYATRSGERRPVRRRSQWSRRREAIREGFESVAGTLPGDAKRCDLSPLVVSEEDCGDFVRKDLTYASEPGGRVPAYLLVPKTAMATAKRRAPAALCLHQTHAAGRKVVVGLGKSPNDEYAVELARRGYVCLAPAYPHLADYAPDLKGLGYASGTMKAIWDNIRGLDLLESLPYVRPGRFFVIGHSLGGHNAIYTAFLEPRIAVVATSCAFDAYIHYMGGNLSGWIQERYLPRFEAYRGRPASIPFDFHELIASLAPRAFFASAPKRDSNFRWRSVRAIEEAVRPVYALWGAGDRLRMRHPDTDHRFPPEMREEAYAFAERWL